MLNDKRFLTHNQQMKYLRTDKNIICKGSKDKEVLSRIGYFNLVNGYKEPFIASEVNGVHIYYTGTRIMDLYNLKKFDDDLRLLLFKYITQVEEEVRTITAYKFDDENKRGKIAWYELDAYDTSKNISMIVKAISHAFSEIDRAKQDYVRHYMEHHAFVPTWIMIKVIHFSTLIDIIDYSKPSIKRAIASLYGIFNSRGFPDYKLLIASLHWLRTVRNSCAHNERIFTIKHINSRVNTNYMNVLAPSYAKERSRKIIDLLVYMKYYLPEDEYYTLMTNVDLLLSGLRSTIHSQAFDRVRTALGIKDINHISLLRDIPKTAPIIYSNISRL
ncbi:MAG: Abi family protein [Oscillospiraceae bacterium]|nr:Abi family protein [Oscillospiraceae bacterium]